MVATGLVKGLRLQSFLFALPALAVYAVFLVYPSLSSVWISFTDWDGLSSNQNFVGLANYERLLGDPVFATAIVNNLVWTAVTLVVPVVLGLILAVALDRKSRAQPLIRLMFYLPGVLPLVAIASIWGWLYNPTDGLINTILDVVGLGGLAQPWLGQDSTALGAIMVPAVWLRTGFPMLLYLAALQAIPREIHEAAMVDGASPWQRFFYITMPSLRSAHYIIIALSLIDSFKVFDLVYAMTAGGPGTSTQVVGTWMYTNVFTYYEMGYGTAMAVLVTLASIAIGIPYILSQTRAST